MKSSRTTPSEPGGAAFDLCSLLSERLELARKRNPRFSLRSFARQLGVEHSTLSQVLRGKRRLSTRDLKSVGRRLGLGEEAVLLAARCDDGKQRGAIPSEKLRSVQFDLDSFQLLSAWYHSAILELVQLREFKPDSRWIARTLGISVETVNVTLQRLLRLDLLEMTARDRWTDKTGDAEFESPALTDSASNRINQDVLDLARESVERFPASRRIHCHMVVALDSTRLPQFRALAERFLRDVRALASAGGRKDDVYQAQISFSPLTTLHLTKRSRNA